MEDYEFVYRDGAIKVLYNGIEHDAGRADIEGETILYVHPTYEEREKGIEAQRLILTQDDKDKIQELIDENETNDENDLEIE